MRILNVLISQPKSVERGSIRAEDSNRLRVGTQLPGIRPRSFRRCGEDGGALVEMALALPVLMMIVFGLFDFGLYIAYYQALTQAVGAAGQYLGHDRGYASDPCAIALAQMQTSSPMNLYSRNTTVQVLYNGTSLGTNSCPSDATSDLGTTGGGTVQVIGTYVYPCPVPFAKVVCSPLVAQVKEYVY